MRVMFKGIAAKIKRTYGFYPNLRRTARHNACLILRNVHPSLLRSRPSNVAYHNLCTNTTLPPSLKSLLGLGLNFCIKPNTSSSMDQIQFDRFNEDYIRRIFFSGQNGSYEKPKLWVKSDWRPPQPDPIFTRRLNNFRSAINRTFIPKKTYSNLLPSQQAAFRWLLDHPDVIVCNTDKNLGPCVMEKERYVEFAHNDHLSDTLTYQELTPIELQQKMNSIRNKIEEWIDFHPRHLRRGTTIEYIIENTKHKPAFMYLMPKIHKRGRLKTRAIISYSGSVCYGIAKYVKVELKKILPHLPYVSTSSRETVKLLRGRTWNATSKLFTCDAKSMYTNIHLRHALPMIEHFLCETTFGRDIAITENLSPAALLQAIEIVMTNNVFQFGDSCWLQLTGTAMGTPPAPDWATLYFCIWEIAVIPQFPELALYQRYIDDGFGIWTPRLDQDADTTRFQEFCTLMSSFGLDHEFFQTTTHKPLEWEFSDRSNTAIFLDLTITLNLDGSISTNIYEKDLNLYLYIPPHSCHSAGVTKGLIYGMVDRAKALCSNPSSYQPFLQRCYRRLLARGHQKNDILPVFHTAIKSIIHDRPRAMEPTQDDKTQNLMFHLDINPADEPSSTIQRIFDETIMNPAGEEPLSSIEVYRHTTVDFRRLTVCYHGQQHIKSTLSPRRGRYPADFSVRDYLQTLRDRDPT